MAMPADYRILSIDYGKEGAVVPDERQLADWRKFAVEEKGIDLIAGHHPQVAQGVELNGKSLIFYSLGNLLAPGAEPSRLGLCRDYGLIAKVHLARVDGAWKVEAIEAIPLTRTQVRPERFTANEGTKRIHALNHLAAGLDDGSERKRRTLHAAPRRLGTLLRRRRRCSRRRTRHALPGLATRGRARQDACGDPRLGLRRQAVLREANCCQTQAPQRRQAPSSGPFGAAGPSFR